MSTIDGDQPTMGHCKTCESRKVVDLRSGHLSYIRANLPEQLLNETGVGAGPFSSSPSAEGTRVLNDGSAPMV
jgi:hypothetical protein